MRFCMDCGTDISARYWNSTRCLECQRLRTKKMVNERARKKRAQAKPKFRACLSCGTNIAHRHGVARRCAPCAKRREALALKAHKVERRKDAAYRAHENKRESERCRKRRAEDAEYREKRNEYIRARRKWRKWRLTPEQIQGVIAKQKGRCAICREVLSEHELDHIFPRSRGGASTVENLQVTCPPCNRRKWSKLHFFPHSGGQGSLVLGFTE